jgi:hypothetical protein
MKRPLILTVVVALVLLAGAVAVRSGEPDLSSAFHVEPGVASGGGYRLTALCWAASGASQGGSYSLLVPAATAQRGSGCCCTYLPLTVRRFR